jgi:uncharacterized membrane protein
MAWRDRLTDERVDIIIGTLLRIGVIAASVVVLFGGIVYLARHSMQSPQYATFHGEPARFTSVRGIIPSAFAFQGRGIIMLGLLLLVLTPIARVLFSAAAFTLQRDRLYVIVTLIVLTVLIVNLVRG